jgi:acyl-CoA thioesterase-1
MVLGDSLSAGYGLKANSGWVDLLQQKLRRENYPHTVINASISGDTTDGALSRLPRALQRHQPDIVIIELGGNDGLRGQPVKKMQDNLKQIIQLCLDHGADVLLVGMQLPPNYGLFYARKFNQVYENVSKYYNIAHVPFLLEGIERNMKYFQADQIHPTEEAQPLLLQNVWPQLQPLLSNES